MRSARSMPWAAAARSWSGLKARPSASKTATTGFRRAADAIEASGLQYTIVRPAWLMDEDEVDYELTPKDEPFKGTVVSRKSVGDLIAKVIANPELHVSGNLGVNKPNTDGDKPYFM
jgi:uncharacterized protein YbjT (DUF2867 family)